MPLLALKPKVKARRRAAHGSVAPFLAFRERTEEEKEAEKEAELFYLKARIQALVKEIDDVARARRDRRATEAKLKAINDAVRARRDRRSRGS